MKANKKELLYSRITKHGQDLKRVFNLDPTTDPVKLCKKLLRLENKAHKLATDYCNGDVDQIEFDSTAMLRALCNCSQQTTVFFEYDQQLWLILSFSSQGDVFMRQD